MGLPGKKATKCKKKYVSDPHDVHQEFFNAFFHNIADVRAQL